MELVKSNICMSRVKAEKNTQITLDDDVIVSDSNPDVDEILAKHTEVTDESVKILDGKILIKGKLCYKILYEAKGESGLYHMSGSIPFDEVINMDEVKDGDNISVNSHIEDVSISTINSRKINVRAVVSFQAYCEEMYNEDVIVDVNDADGADYIKKPLEVLNLVINKKDVYRIKEEIELDNNKPNVGQIIWDNMCIRDLNFALQNDVLEITGNMNAFIMYMSEDGSGPISFFDKTMPFKGYIDVEGATTDMIPGIDVKMYQGTPEIVKDSDGENRIIRCEVVISVDIKVYEEEQVSVITDIYSPYVNLVKEEKAGSFYALLVHNQSATKVSGRRKFDSTDRRMLQICNSTCTVKIDESQITESGINVTGVADVNVVYVSTRDDMPFGYENILVPFEHNIEAPGTATDCVFFIRPKLDELNVTMVSTDEVEAKVSISLDTMVIKPLEVNVITSLSEEPYDDMEIRKSPSVVIHFVKEGESIWQIAKQYHTTAQSIMTVNHLQTENLKKGMSLILVKQVAHKTSV